MGNTKHGGPRPGAGRPSTENKRRLVSMRLSPKTIEALKMLQKNFPSLSIGRIVDEAMRFFLTAQTSKQEDSND